MQCVCVCVCMGERGECVACLGRVRTGWGYVCACVRVRVRARARACVCVAAGGGRSGMCVCVHALGAGGVCVRVCVWCVPVGGAGRDRGRESQPGKGRRSGCVVWAWCVCVCVCVWGGVVCVWCVWWAGRDRSSQAKDHVHGWISRIICLCFLSSFSTSAIKTTPVKCESAPTSQHLSLARQTGECSELGGGGGVRDLLSPGQVESSRSAPEPDWSKWIRVICRGSV